MDGTGYQRLIATRGKDYLLVYNYSAAPMQINLNKISGKTKKAWWYCPRNGNLLYIGDFNEETVNFHPKGKPCNGNDWVLIVTDSNKKYTDSLL